MVSSSSSWSFLSTSDAVTRGTLDVIGVGNLFLAVKIIASPLDGRREQCNLLTKTPQAEKSSSEGTEACHNSEQASCEFCKVQEASGVYLPPLPRAAGLSCRTVTEEDIDLHLYVANFFVIISSL